MRPINYKRVSEVCGLIPLFVGSAIFCAWLAIRDPIYMLLGAFTFIGGLLLFCVGLLALFLHDKKIRPNRKDLIRPAIFLFINFPVAVSYGFIGIYIEFSQLVTLQNDCPDTVQIELFESPNQRSIMAIDIESGTSASKRFHSLSEGAVTYELILNGNLKEKGTLIGYTTPGLSGHTDLRITEKCTAEIK